MAVRAREHAQVEDRAPKSLYDFVLANPRRTHVFIQTQGFFFPTKKKKSVPCAPSNTRLRLVRRTRHTIFIYSPSADPFRL